MLQVTSKNPKHTLQQLLRHLTQNLNLYRTIEYINHIQNTEMCTSSTYFTYKHGTFYNMYVSYRNDHLLFLSVFVPPECVHADFSLQTDSGFGYANSFPIKMLSKQIFRELQKEEAFSKPNKRTSLSNVFSLNRSEDWEQERVCHTQCAKYPVAVGGSPPNWCSSVVLKSYKQQITVSGPGSNSRHVLAESDQHERQLWQPNQLPPLYYWLLQLSFYKINPKLVSKELCFLIANIHCFAGRWNVKSMNNRGTNGRCYYQKQPRNQGNSTTMCSNFSIKVLLFKLNSN